MRGFLLEAETRNPHPAFGHLLPGGEGQTLQSTYLMIACKPDDGWTKTEGRSRKVDCLRRNVIHDNGFPSRNGDFLRHRSSVIRHRSSVIRHRSSVIGHFYVCKKEPLDAMRQLS